MANDSESSFAILDSKLISLINVCKKTGNFKKIAVVSFVLIDNMVNEIGIRLGIRPRKKTSGEKIFEYIAIINEIFQKNLEVQIFKDTILRKIKLIELAFLKKKGDLPLQAIKEILKFYYELRKLEVPNLHEQINEDTLPLSENTELYSNFFSSSLKIRKNGDFFKSMLLNELKRERRDLKKPLSEKITKDMLERAIYLKAAKESIENSGDNKIKIESHLKDNLDYQKSASNLLGYSLIGVFLLFFFLGFSIVIETVFYPILIGVVAILILMFLGFGFLLLFLYWNYYEKGGN